MEVTKSFPKVFVTGAPGWLGTRLVECIAKGLSDNPLLAEGIETQEICVFSLPGQDTKALKAIDNRITCFTGDVRNQEDVENWLKDSKDALIFHIAGVIHPGKLRELNEINYLGTKRILETAEINGVKKIVVMSSNSPFGVNPHNDHLFDENSPYNPYMGYGKSKMKMELEVTAAQRRGKLRTTIIRAPWFYGPNQPDRQALFFSMVKDGKAPIVGSGDNLRSMSYIDNLCQGLLLAAIHKNANGKAYWIADEKPYSMNNIVGTIEDILEKDFFIPCAHKRMKLPGIASEVALLIDGTLQKMGLYHQKIHVLSEMNKNIACDISLAKKELGYVPKYELREGMKKSIQWGLNNGQKI